MAPTTPTQREVNAVRKPRSSHSKPQPSTSISPSTVSSSSATIPASKSTDATSFNDAESTVSSTVSSSSEEPSSDSDSDEDSDMDDAPVDDATQEDTDGIVNLRANRGKKPVMKLDTDEMEDIRPFLRDFLPKLKAANEDLEAQRRAGTLETVEIVDTDEAEDGDGEGKEEDDGKQYIELNLGLGVLEAESADGKKTMDNKDVDEGSRDVLGELMGREKAEAGVQVVEEQGERKN